MQASVCTSVSKFEFWQPCWWRQKIKSEEFDNGALFLPVDLPSAIIRHENGTFWKRSFGQTRGIWKRLLCVLVWTENILKAEFIVSDDVAIIMIFPCPRLTQTQVQTDWWFCSFKFLSRGVDGKHLMRFQNETSVFQLLLHSVDGAYNVDFLSNKVLSPISVRH